MARPIPTIPPMNEIEVRIIEKEMIMLIPVLAIKNILAHFFPRHNPVATLIEMIKPRREPPLRFWPEIAGRGLSIRGAAKPLP
jgi:hypothetical protein